MIVVNSKSYQETVLRNAYKFNKAILESHMDDILVQDELMSHYIETYADYMMKDCSENDQILEELPTRAAEDNIVKMLYGNQYRSNIIAYDNHMIIWKSVLNSKDHMSILASSMEISTFAHDLSHCALKSDCTFDVYFYDELILIKNRGKYPNALGTYKNRFTVDIDTENSFGFIYMNGMPAIAVGIDSSDQTSVIKMEGMFVIIRGEYRELEYGIIDPFLAIIKESLWNRNEPILDIGGDF